MHQLIIILAKYAIAVPVIALLYVFIWPAKGRRIQFLVFLFISALSATLLTKLAATLHQDPRPFITDGVKPYFASSVDNGFPSDHTVFSALIALVVFRYSRKLGIILVVLAVIIGTSRVIAGVHHGVDIVGGLLVAGLSYGVACLALHYFSRSSRHEPAIDAKH